MPHEIVVLEQFVEIAPDGKLYLKLTEEIVERLIERGHAWIDLLTEDGKHIFRFDITPLIEEFRKRKERRKCLAN